MNPNSQIQSLENIYRLYNTFADSRTFACKAGCATCCTRNVTLTTLEGRNIIRHLKTHDDLALIDQIKSVSGKRRFIPLVTTNRLASFCMDGVDPPDEELNPNWTPCPLLFNSRCAIYPVRPFGCRCLVSTIPCRETSFAQIDPYTVTVNNVMMQIIEHLDGEGMTGNVIDVLPFLAQNETQGYPRTAGPTENMIHNSTIPVLMIPPEHRVKIKPLLMKLGVWK